MIFFLIPFIEIIIAILLLFLFKKSNSIEKKVCVTIFIINICLILYLKVLFQSYITNLFWLIILFNIIFLILFNSKLILKKKIALLLLTIYFICLIFIPIYKFEDHEHVFIDENNNNNIASVNTENTSNNTITNTMRNEAEKYLNLRIEKIENFIDYYNFYGIKLKRIYLTD